MDHQGSPLPFCLPPQSSIFITRYCGGDVYIEARAGARVPWGSSHLGDSEATEQVERDTDIRWAAHPGETSSPQSTVDSGPSKEGLGEQTWKA